ncbi:hypothetical protein DPMN_082971 [Dreissena polymorpha]|uniref:Uncharacterized protein n=1 Tax=Dreissena polymorpha TaxID=45954 RepID=A0A9D4BAM8_DREPO|nr:hypothetical protein DPMN_082971 [Dreissena polymorpha]
MSSKYETNIITATVYQANTRSHCDSYSIPSKQQHPHCDSDGISSKHKTHIVTALNIKQTPDPQCHSYGMFSKYQTRIVTATVYHANTRPTLSQLQV